LALRSPISTYAKRQRRSAPRDAFARGHENDQPPARPGKTRTLTS